MRQANTKRGDFNDANASVAKTIGEDGVQVVAAGSGAYTTKDTIHVPGGDPSEKMSVHAQEVQGGYVNHEVAHHRYGDMDVIIEAMNDDNPLYTEMVNAMEDMRIEPQMFDEYPGSKDDLMSTCEEVNKLTLQEIEDGNLDLTDPKVMTPVAVTWEGRRRQGMSDTNEELLSKVPAGIREKAAKICDLIEGARDGKAGSKDVADMARHVVDEIEKESGTPPLPPTSWLPGGPCTDGPKGDEEVEVQPRDGEGEGQTPAPEGDDEGEVKVKVKVKGHGATDDAKPIPFSTDLAKAVESVSEKDATATEDKYVPFSTDFDFVHTKKDEGRMIPAYNIGWGDDGKAVIEPRKMCDGELWNQSVYEGLMNDGHRGFGKNNYAKIERNMKGAINVMSQKFRRALMAKQQRSWSRGEESGRRIDTGNLVQAYQGYPYVWQDREDAEEINTAVTLLIDHSGSMSGPELALAQKATIALSRVLDAAGIPFEVLGFFYGANPHTKALRRAVLGARQGMRFDTDGQPLMKDGSLVLDHDKSHKYSRWEGLHHIEYKEFNERLQVCKTAIGNMHSMASGCNCDGESVRWAWERLAVRPEQRKVILVLSDGYPAFFTDFPGQEHTHLRDTVAYIGREGGSLVGIGINSSAVKRFYPKYVVLSDIKELPKTVMDQLSKLLLGERFVIDNGDLLKVTNNNLKRSA